MELRRSVRWLLQYQQDGRLDGVMKIRGSETIRLGVKKRRVRKGQS